MSHWIKWKAGICAIAHRAIPRVLHGISIQAK